MRFVAICTMCVISVFLFSCSNFGHKSLDYEQLADQLTDKTAKKIMKQKNICLVGTGGRMMHDIQVMDMGFYAYREVDLTTARELLVSVVDEYLANINGNEEIQPYLHDHPFTAKNVEIRIWFFNPDGSNLPIDKLFAVESIDGILSYHLSDSKRISCITIHKETYEEACARLKEPESRESISAVRSTDERG